MIIFKTWKHERCRFMHEIYQKLKHSNENDVVMDTFMGSGTTALACKNTKRNFRGCEISKEYYDKILKVL